MDREITIKKRLFCDRCPRKRRREFAIIFCSSCDEVYCQDCAKPHSLLRSYSNHETTLIDEANDLCQSDISHGNANSVCDRCSIKNLQSPTQFYCKTCEESFCDRCVRPHQELRTYLTHNTIVINDYKLSHGTSHQKGNRGFNIGGDFNKDGDKNAKIIPSFNADDIISAPSQARFTQNTVMSASINANMTVFHKNKEETVTSFKDSVQKVTYLRPGDSVSSQRSEEQTTYFPRDKILAVDSHLNEDSVQKATSLRPEDSVSSQRSEDQMTYFPRHKTPTDVFHRNEDKRPSTSHNCSISENINSKLEGVEKITHLKDENRAMKNGFETCEDQKGQRGCTKRHKKKLTVSFDIENNEKNKESKTIRSITENTEAPNKNEIKEEETQEITTSSLNNRQTNTTTDSNNYDNDVLVDKNMEMEHLNTASKGDEEMKSPINKSQSPKTREKPIGMNTKTEMRSNFMRKVTKTGKDSKNASLTNVTERKPNMCDSESKILGILDRIQTLGCKCEKDEKVFMTRKQQLNKRLFETKALILDNLDNLQSKNCISKETGRKVKQLKAKFELS